MYSRVAIRVVWSVVCCTGLGEFGVETLVGDLFSTASTTVVDFPCCGIGSRLMTVVHLVVAVWVLVCSGGLPAAAAVDLHPVVFTVFHFSGITERFGQDLTEMIVVWSLLKSEVSAVFKVFSEFLWYTGAEFSNGNSGLFVTNLFVLLLVGLSLQSLPGESTTQEVDEDVTKGLEIISA